MKTRYRSALAAAFATPFLFAALVAVAQTHPAPPAKAAPAAAPAAPVPTVRDEHEVVATQNQLIKILRSTPTLTTVLSHDPSLLADSDYIARNSPELAGFLAAHPEVVRSPDYYLFTHIQIDGQDRSDALERAVWPDVYRAQPERSEFAGVLDNLVPLLAFLGFLVVLVWILRLFVENRRWSRTFALQSEVHSKLIEKFSTSQELASYMETDAGRRFLEAAPIPIQMESTQRVPNAVARVLTPLQIGIVMVLLGAGLLSLRNVGHDTFIGMSVLGTVILMPGLGFIISAGITWILAGRLGLMPTPPLDPRHNGGSFGPNDRL